MGLLLLCLLQAAQTLYAMWLNSFFYCTFPPFFDSMGYMLSYAEILTLARDAGVVKALQAAFHSGTVSLPWIFTAVFSPLLPYSRHPGIWYQELWMTTLVCSVFYYLSRYRHLPPWLAFCYALPFVCFRGVYSANGGVSDFRMDLLLYLFLANMSIWYLATYETDSWIPWAASGLFLLLCVLSRATSPVYMAAMFGPILLARLLQGDRRMLSRLAVFWLPPGALGVVALYVNYQLLHYYYFEWGADPNANLPLWKASLHVLLAGYSIGVPLTLVCVPALFYALRAGKFRNADYTIFWLGTAPVLLLVLRGAGLNPFVSMPAVFGWLLFCLLPFRGHLPFKPRTQLRLAWLLLAACGLNAAYGIRQHTDPPGLVPAMPAMRAAIDRMHDDALHHGRHQANFATAHIVDFEETALRNVLVFDYGAIPRGGDYPYAGVTFRTPHAGIFNAAVPLTWQQDIPGRTDDEKLGTLLKFADRDIDYFFLPDAPSLTWQEHNRAFNFINTKTREFKRRLLATGRWEPLGEPLVASPYETVSLYRKR